MHSMRWIFVPVLCLSIFSSVASADTDRFSILPLYPMTGASHFVYTYGSDSVDEWELGRVSQYAYFLEPLAETVAGVRRAQKVINHFLVQFVRLEFGLFPFGAVSVSLPVVNVNQIVLGGGLFDDRILGFGDVQVEQYFTLLSRHASGFGLALVPWIRFPTGDDSRFIGDGEITGGVRLAVDAQVISSVAIGINAGVILRSERIVFDEMFVQNRLFLSGGIFWQVTQSFGLMADVVSRTSLEHPFENVAETPVELWVGTHTRFGDSGWFFSARFAFEMTEAVEVAERKVMLGLSYRTPPQRGRDVASVNAQRQSRFVVEQDIYFEGESGEVIESNRVIVKRVAEHVSGLGATTRLAIRSFANAGGDDAFNRRLSLQRAKAIAQMLTEYGVENHRLELRGFGQDFSQSSQAPTLDPKLNNRVEIRVLE